MPAPTPPLFDLAASVAVVRSGAKEKYAYRPSGLAEITDAIRDLESHEDALRGLLALSSLAEALADAECPAAATALMELVADGCERLASLRSKRAAVEPPSKEVRDLLGQRERPSEPSPANGPIISVRSLSIQPVGLARGPR
jgi:hypothetical protein